MLLQLPADSGAPLHEQVAAAVRSAVAAGHARPGERLPSARDLAGDLQVNMHTVLRAYQTLRDEGVLELRRGRGAVIAADPHQAAELADAARALVRAAQRHGLTRDALLELVETTLTQTQHGGTS